MPEAPNIPVWQAATDYNEGDMVLPTTYRGLVAIAENTGTSGATEPDWPGVRETYEGDGDIDWTMRDAVYSCPLEPTQLSLYAVRQELQKIKVCLGQVLSEFLRVRDGVIADVQVVVREIVGDINRLDSTIGDYQGEALLDETGAELVDEDGLTMHEEAGTVLSRALLEEMD